MRYDTEERILCPKWSRCKATRKCPLEKEIEGKKVYVKSNCVGFKQKLVMRKAEELSHGVCFAIA